MNRSFNSIRRLAYQLYLSPFTLVLVPYLCAIVATILTSDALWLFLALLCALAYIALGAAARAGHPRLWARTLTPNFYMVRTLSGRYSVFQRSLGHVDCRKMIRTLIAEQVRLPAALPAGRYQALTHAVVIRRLQTLDNARDVTVKFAYMASMEPIYSRMTGGRCKKCCVPCHYYAASKKPRKFYLVRFTLEKGPISAPGPVSKLTKTRY